MQSSPARLDTRILNYAFAAFLVVIGSLTAAATANAQAGSNTPIRPRPTTQPAPVGQSAVNGRAVYKDNAQPLKGARVRIFAANDPGNSFGLVAVTNERGEFHVENLAAGKYYVTLDGPGIARQSGFGMKIPLPVSAIPRREDFEEIVPKHDAQFTVDGKNTVDVEVKIARGGTISGKILKADGAPVANVDVNLVSREGSYGPYTARFSARTNKDGFYKIEDLPEGDYVVGAAIEDKATSLDMRARLRGELQVVTYHPATISIRDAVAVNVTSGRETEGVNVTLVARSTFAVSGTVMQQRDGTPLVGATVLLRNKDAELGGALVPGMGQRTARTDTDGRWSFSNVMEGSYVVTALAPTSRPSRLPSEEPPDREQAFRESRQRFLVTQQEITVAGADVSNLLMAISGPGSIVGRVETDNGAPLPANFVIFFELVGQGHRPGPPMPVRVKSDGSFTLSGIQGGEVNFVMALPPNSKYFVKTLSASGADLWRFPLRVVEGAEAGPVQVVISQEVGFLTGRIVPANANQPTSDVVVLMAPVDPEKQRFRSAYLTARPGADGTFSLSGAPGEYFVFAKRRDELPGIVTEDFVRTEAQNAQRIVLASGEQKRMDLRLD